MCCGRALTMDHFLRQVYIRMPSTLVCQFELHTKPTQNEQELNLHGNTTSSWVSHSQRISKHPHTKRKTMLEPTFRYFGSRLLQSSNSDELRFNQFIGFVLWYVLLLGCCLIPIICAYRRNRWQSRLSRAAHLRQMAAIGTFHLGDSIRNEVLSRQAREENKQRIELAITSTTMVSRDR